MNGQTARERREELLRAAVSGDKAAVDTFVEENLSLVWSVLQRFLGRGYEAEDLFQVGAMGLLKAVQKFDFSFGVQFSTYAVPMIIGEIKRYMRDDGMVKVSRSIKELAIKAKIKGEELRRMKSADPSVNEIAKALDVSEEDVVFAMAATQPHESVYTSVLKGDHQDVTLLDTLRDTADTEKETIDKITVADLLENLKDRDRKIILMRYFRRKTQAEVAEILNISQVQVSRLEKKILESLRAELCGDNPKNQRAKNAKKSP